MAEQVNVTPTPVNPVIIKGAIAFSAEHARIWAEGTDAQVEQLGGEHSAKGWAQDVGEGSKEYTDQQIAIATQEMTAEINRQSLSAITQSKNYTDSSVSAESGLRQSADSNLQEQIDALAASSDVTDIVGTYAELEAYDTTHLKDNDIIKVLDDSTHDDTPSYYRWDKETEEFTYIGSESASYTKAQADAKFLTQTSAASTYATQSSVTSSLSAKQDKSTAVTHNALTSVGGTTQPVYIASDGTATPTTYSLAKSVPSDAVFTDTTYSDFTGADGTNAGAAGLVPAPAATDNAKFLKGDGTWSTVDSLPSQTGNSGKYLTTNGTTASWAAVDSLPSQTGNSGKFLTTNGTSASWATMQGGIPTLTWYTGNEGTTVTIADTTGATLVKIYKNGILLQPTQDYSISGTTLTLVTALVSADKITVEQF